MTFIDSLIDTLTAWSAGDPAAWAVFATTAAAVTLAEIGDKTQLLALLLVCRYQKPWPILLGIFVATVANHALAASAGILIAHWIPEFWLTLMLGVGFLAMAAWILVPDQEDELKERSGGNVFWITTVLFFIVEMGDKTQIATAALAATFDALLIVTFASTLGMLLANAPVLWLGAQFACNLPLRWIRGLSAALFAVIGLWLISSLIFTR
ncbi:MAG: TMEM165/GDT1 family protein [Thioalkalivibrionaceae bacterium]